VKFEFKDPTVYPTDIKVVFGPWKIKMKDFFFPLFGLRKIKRKKLRGKLQEKFVLL